jgi:hypothetical protein
MSVSISVWNPEDKSPTISAKFYNVIGYVIAAVVKHEDGKITLEREISVTADDVIDNQLAESVVKTIEEKLNEAFPDPNQQPKLWVPK